MPNQWNPENTFRRAEDAVARGDLWRVKEIYKGCVVSQCFDADTYERYGSLLNDLGDKMEAGRFFFLCGVRMPEYKQPIGLFLSRYGGKAQVLFNEFPRRFRNTEWSLLPGQTMFEAKKLGLSKRQFDTYRKAHPIAREKGSPLDIVGVVIGFTLLGAVVLCFIVGFATVAKTILDWLF